MWLRLNQADFDRDETETKDAVEDYEIAELGKNVWVTSDNDDTWVNSRPKTQHHFNHQ